jgi:hypothetical protein
MNKPITIIRLFQVYPRERHGIRQAKASEHYEASVLSFLEHNL